MTVPIPLRMAAVLLWLNAVMFGVPCLIGMNSLASGRGIASIAGFPAYGYGPFETNGVDSTVGLLAAFLMVCVFEGVAGWLLWGGRRSGAILALVLLPVGAAFWWGFNLPIPPLMALGWTALILASWRSLR